MKATRTLLAVLFVAVAAACGTSPTAPEEGATLGKIGSGNTIAPTYGKIGSGN